MEYGLSSCCMAKARSIWPCATGFERKMYATPTMKTMTTTQSDCQGSNRRKCALGAVKFFGYGDVAGVETAPGLGKFVSGIGTSWEELQV